MKKHSVTCLLAILFITQLACRLFTAAPTAAPVGGPAAPYPTALGSLAETLPAGVASPEPTLTSLPAVEPAVSSPFSLDGLKNYSYRLEDFGAQAALVDGLYDDDQIHTRLIEPVAFGDLNGDGRTDAAVILATNSGGSGTFYDLVVLLDQAGTPVQLGIAYIGDRQVVNQLEIENGRIVLDYLTQGLRDALCCPSERRLRSYLLENGSLRLASEQVLADPAVQATPLPNAILIDQPAMDAPFTTPLQVHGRVSLVPPEKRLAYYVTDFDAVMLAQGEVPLEGEPGGPGAFAFEINLSPDSPGLFYLELVDSAGGILRGRSVVVLITP
jgi:hypothetical protein